MCTVYSACRMPPNSAGLQWQAKNRCLSRYLNTSTNELFLHISTVGSELCGFEFMRQGLSRYHSRCNTGAGRKLNLTDTSAPKSPIPSTRHKPLTVHSFLTLPMIPMLAHDFSARFLCGKDCRELCVVFRDVPSEEGPLYYLLAVWDCQSGMQC